MKKDYIPLWIALASGVFGLLTTIADNLTKNLVIQVPLKTVQKNFNLINYFMTNPKLVFFVGISIVAVIVFLIIKFKRHRTNRRRK